MKMRNNLILTILSEKKISSFKIVKNVIFKNYFVNIPATIEVCVVIVRNEFAKDEKN